MSEKLVGEKRKLNGAEKAAALLMFLGEEISADVFKRLGDDEIRLIVTTIPRMGDVTPEIMESVLSEFNDRITQEGCMGTMGRDFIENVVNMAMGESRGQSMLTRLEVEERLDRIRRYDSRTVFNLIKKEHPQTIAFILSQLPPTTTSEIIALLPEDLQYEVVLRIAQMDTVLPGALEEVLNVLGSELSTFSIDVDESTGGVKPAAEILNSMKKSIANEIISKIEEENADLAEEIGRHMFVFEDLLNVDDRGIQMILKEVGNDDLAISLKMAGEDVKQKIFNNISTRASEMIQKDMAARGPVRILDVEKAQQMIVRVARRLEREGKIVVAGRGGEIQFV